MSNQIRETINWFKQWHNKELVLETEFTEYKVKLNRKDVYHLLGLHYLHPLKHRATVESLDNFKFIR